MNITKGNSKITLHATRIYRQDLSTGKTEVFNYPSRRRAIEAFNAVKRYRNL